MTWFAAGAAVVGAAAQYYGSTQATNASKDANKKNSQLSQQQYNNSLMMMEPNRMLGYQAGADLSNLYGWATPGYTSAQQLVNGQYAGSGTGGVNGAAARELAGNDIGKKIDPVANTLVNFAFGSNKGPRYGGNIDPSTGTVTVKGDPKGLSAALTQYLRTGQMPEGRKFGKEAKRLTSAIDELRASGWTYDPATGVGTTPGQAATNANGLGAQPAGQPGNMDRFFTSPDYQFRLGESIKASDQSAAARGGALSGNALRANTALAGNLASGEYNNYVNNLFRAMGYGQNATQDTVNSGNTYVNQQGALNQQMGDIRGSGVAQQYGYLGGALNTLGQAYSGYLGSRTPSSSGVSANSFSPNYGFSDLPRQSWDRLNYDQVY